MLAERPSAPPSLTLRPSLRASSDGRAAVGATATACSALERSLAAVLYSPTSDFAPALNFVGVFSTLVMARKERREAMCLLENYFS